MLSPTVQKLINLFAKFPTIGPRTASRFAFYLLEKDQKEVDELISAILKLKEKVKLCSNCYKSFEPSVLEKELCEICQNPKRDKSLLCLISRETDLAVIEKTKKYQGLYFILGGTISRLKKDELKKLRIKEFIKRAKDPGTKEIILALNQTTEGETTALYLERALEKNLAEKKQTTRLGRGLPVGSELEYADQETLSSALEGRK